MPDCVAIVDKDRRIIACNWYGSDSFPRHLKHANLFCHEIFEIEGGQGCQPCVIDTVFASGRPGTFEKVLADIGTVQIEASPVFDEEGRMIFVVQHIHFPSSKHPDDDILGGTGVMETSDTAFAVADVDGKIRHVNSTFLKLWGYENRDAVAGKELAGLWRHSKEGCAALESLLRQEYLSAEMAGKKSDGGTLCARVSGSLIKNSFGEPICLWVSFLDDSHYRPMEQQLQSGEIAFREMADDLPQTIFEADSLGRITFANAYAFRLFGYDQSDIDAGMNILQVVAPRDRLKAMGLAQRVLQGEREVMAEVEACRRDGSTFPVLVCSNPIARDDRIIGFRGMLMDISGQKHIEKSLRRSQQLYKALVEKQVELVIRWRPDTTLTYVNPAYCRFFDKTEDRLVGQKFLRQVPEIYHKYLLRQIDKVLEKPETVYSEFQSIAADGSPVWHRWSDTPILDQAGNVIEFQSVGMDITELKQAYQKLHHSEMRYQHLALHDPLTGLPNRLMLLDRITHLIAKSRRFGRAFAVLVADLDRFKKVTDALGHDGADRVLCQVGQRFREVVRESDLLAKVSGDEFVIVCDEIRDADSPSVLARHLLDSLSVPFEIDGHILSLSASIGISLWQEGGSDVDQLLKEADLAMLEGKRQGGHRYLFYTGEMNERSREHDGMESLLRRALKDDALHLAFLPQIDPVTERTVGIEALVRIRDASGRIIMPGEFVPVAEKTGLILELGDRIMEKACEQNRLWQEAGLPPRIVTVNVSPEQFRQRDFAAKVIDILVKTGLKPRWLELEIKENAIMENVAHAIEVMDVLNRIGVGFAIDDFGKGCSSLTHLRHLPLAKLKIDRTFTRGVPDNPLDVKLVNAVVAMAKSLGIKIVAEGIESAGQYTFFKELRCDFVQGFLYGAPRTAEEMHSFLKN